MSEADKIIESQLRNLRIGGIFLGKKVMSIERSQESSTYEKWSIRLAAESEKRAFEIRNGKVQIVL